MSLISIASKIIGGACVVALSFWITLTLLDYQATPWTWPLAPEEGASGGAAPASRTIRLFDERGARVDDLAVTWNAAEAPDGSRTAALLEDRSRTYGRIFQEVPVADDEKTHTFSIDVKPGTSPFGAIHMTYLGGRQPKTFHVLMHLNNPSEDMLPSGEGQISSRYLGDNWFKITLSGANNGSGNTKLLVQFFPRHGAPQDTGSCT